MVKYNDSAKHIHRPIPCPAYDLAAMEAWLEDMARQGLLLSRDGFFFGFADFEKASPCSMRYRMHAASKGKSAFDEGEPPEDEASFNEDMGWEYVARRGDFHIYRCRDLHAPELNTDPFVQAQTVKAVQKRMVSHLISTVIWLIIYPILFFDTGIVRGTVVSGTFFFFLSTAIVLWALISEIRALATIAGLKKALQMGNVPDKKENPRKSALRYHLSKILFIFAIMLWIVLAFGLFIRYSENERPLEDFPGDIPFATLREIFPDAENYEAADFMGITNIYEYVSAPLIAPEAIIWREAADFELPGLGAVGGNLTVHYYEMSSPLLAKILLWEIERKARSDKYFSPLPTPDIEADYILAYTDHFSNVLIRVDNMVVEASFFPYGNADIPLEH